MNKHMRYILPALAGIITFASCTKDAIKPDPSKVENINAWIYEIMDQHYLWYQDLPDKKLLDMNLSPDLFFDRLISKEKDGKTASGTYLPFSHIDKKTSQTKSYFEDISYGFDCATLDLKNGKYAAQVMCALPGSPAADAGLERGEWIIAANSTDFNITDSKTFRTGGEVTFQLARYDNSKKTFYPTRVIKLAAARAVEETPFLKDSVYHEGGKSIGYLLYNTFASGPEGYKDDAYNVELKQIFREFKSQQVTEMVLDLRYNGGGLLSCASLMASLLAPENALGKDFAHLTYNGRNNKNNSVTKLETAASVSGENLNLSRLYVLVGGQTASASEAVINGLYPYMGESNIILIGLQTLGKNVGSDLYGDNEEYGWLLRPITFHIFNANDKADYGSGFKPDIELNELNTSATWYPLGDTRDLLLGRAIHEITGGANLKSMQESSGEEGIELHYTTANKKISGLLIPEEN